MPLDDFLPVWDARERHSCPVAAPPERVYEAVRAVTPGEVPLVRLLFALRSLPARLGGGGSLPADKDEPLLDQLLGFGFTLLAESDAEVVVGLIDQAWKLTGGETVRAEDARRFVEFDRPGFIKAAMSFSVREERGGTTLETETRVLATDPASRRKFARYWRVIRPGSGVVRRSWLKAAKRRAERAG